MIPPHGAVCIEPGCEAVPTTTRPITQAWLTATGAASEGDEWVCASHAPGHVSEGEGK